MARARKKGVLFKEKDEVYIQHTEETLAEMTERLDLTVGAWRNRAARQNEPVPVPKHLKVMIRQSAALKKQARERLFSSTSK